MTPGLSYVAVSWQLAAEAVVPLNSEAGRSIGARTQLLLFLDELGGVDKFDPVTRGCDV
jgi:hypothetical protein